MLNREYRPNDIEIKIDLLRIDTWAAANDEHLINEEVMIWLKENASGAWDTGWVKVYDERCGPQPYRGVPVISFDLDRDHIAYMLRWG